jgi:hypothetical protein
MYDSKISGLDRTIITLRGIKKAMIFEKSLITPRIPKKNIDLSCGFTTLLKKAVNHVQ